LRFRLDVCAYPSDLFLGCGELVGQISIAGDDTVCIPFTRATTASSEPLAEEPQASISWISLGMSDITCSSQF
jgi:hypothetical protein